VDLLPFGQGFVSLLSLVFLAVFVLVLHFLVQNLDSVHFTDDTLTKTGNKKGKAPRTSV